MEIIIGKNAGFCYGVKRAVDGAKNNSGAYCLGEIVHNENVIENLKKSEIKFIDNIDDANSNVIIRAHGVERKIYKRAKEMNLNIIDLTCPSVLKVHDVVRYYSKKGYFILLTGKKEHPEVVGIVSEHLKNDYIVINSVDELNDNIDKILKNNKILLVSQTTFNSSSFDEICNTLRKKINNDTKLVVKKTICSSTENRQKETEEIAKNVDLMIIVGDKKSSNTNKLYDISKKYCSDVLFIKDKNELEYDNIKEKNKIGIMAGASTPIEDVIEVKEKIENESFKNEILELENSNIDDTYISGDGKRKVMFTAPHTMKQKREDGTIKLNEPFTKAIAMYVAKHTNSYYFVKNKDTGIDSNHSEKDEFKDKLVKKIKRKKIKISIDIHGASYSRDFEIEIGNLDGATCQKETLDSIIKSFRNNGIFNIKINEPFKGGKITKTVASNTNAQALQIEINENYRNIDKIEKMKKVCDSLIGYINLKW